MSTIRAYSSMSTVDGIPVEILNPSGTQRVLVTKNLPGRVQGGNLPVEADYPRQRHD